MNILFFAFVYFFFLILQTCILPYSSWLFLCFGLDLVPVLLVSIRYRHYAVCICLALAGLLMDSLSGCAFFTHMFSYIWIYILVQGLKRLVFLKSFFFLLITVVSAICIEFGMMLLPVLLARGQIPDAWLLYSRQAAMAIITIPVMIWTIDVLRIRWITLGKSMQEKWIQYKD